MEDTLLNTWIASPLTVFSTLEFSFRTGWILGYLESNVTQVLQCFFTFSV